MLRGRVTVPRKGQLMTRTLLVIAVFAFFALCAVGMWWGFRNRARRQAGVLPAFRSRPPT